MFMHKFRLYSAVHIHMHGCGLICWPNPPTISVSVGVWYFDTKSRQCFVWSIQLKTKPVTKKSVKHSSFLAFLKHPLLCAKFGSSIKTRNKRLQKYNSSKLVLAKPLNLWCSLSGEGGKKGNLREIKYWTIPLMAKTTSFSEMYCTHLIILVSSWKTQANTVDASIKKSTYLYCVLQLCMYK